MCRRWSQVTVQSVDHLHSSCRTAMVVTAPLPAIVCMGGFKRQQCSVSTVVTSGSAVG